MALGDRAKTLGMSALLHGAIAFVLITFGREILAPQEDDVIVELEILPDEVELPTPEPASIPEPEPEIPVVPRPERVPEKVVARVTEKARPFQDDAVTEEGSREAPDDAQAIPVPTTPLTFAMTATVGGGSGLEYTSTTGGTMALPPPGPAGGVVGDGFAPGATDVKVARDWQITRRAQPTNDRSFEPFYPPLAKKQGREAVIVVELDIDKSGHVAFAKAIRGTTKHGFREAAIAYARKLRFDPARAGNDAVASRIEWTVHFYVRL